MGTVYRQNRTLFSYAATTNVTNVVATGYGGRRMSQIGPPYVLSLSATADGATVDDSPTVVGKIQDSADNVTFANVTGFTLTSITGTTTTAPTTKQKTYATQLRAYVRFIATTITAGTWQSGFTLAAVITGEA